MKQYISNILQYAADVMSSDPAIQQARREGLEKIKAAKAEKKALLEKCRVRKHTMKELQKAERAALCAKQRAELKLLIEENKNVLEQARKAIERLRQSMHLEIQEIRKRQQASVPGALGTAAA